MSIMSFPERGPWGSPAWRGNCSGHIYKELFELLKPKTVCDPFAGSGTIVDVAKEMGIECVGLDLSTGFNVLRDSILAAVGKQVDFCIGHPPYSGMITYSGKAGMWGDEPHPDDLSWCASDEDFCDKLTIALLNQRAATKTGGVYGTIIGDWRRDGQYSSYQAEVITRMPKNELASVIIKTQHNTTSGRKTYGRMRKDALPAHPA